jgi:mannose-6-phosphate isomerase-like protein (cupin superfamily)
MSPLPQGNQVSLSDALAKLPGSHGERFASVLSHGSLLVEIYAPRGRDIQNPHTRDELYIVMRGNGTFNQGGRRSRFQPGDVLFVPAGVEHRFETFTDDLAVWVVFYGPEGGEAGLY